MISKIAQSLEFYRYIKNENEYANVEWQKMTLVLGITLNIKIQCWKIIIWQDISKTFIRHWIISGKITTNFNKQLKNYYSNMY